MTATRNTGIGALALSAALIGASAAGALTLADCARVTHISHGGEAAHRDLGDGVVAWANWWSQEGVQETLLLADCREGQMLSVVTRSENMNRALPFDRTDRAASAIETMSASPVMRGFAQIAERLEGMHLAPALAALTTEPCACAAAYPAARGDRPAFEMETL
jgi:hypothetical protein